ncbi:16S rRNA (cytidine1402-2'-O)-methyltransferase [Hasllibacter halocynthiae]|uniref:Ribosomal RNA small subunit methyltransferase I n=1 Tax=Hasllibacter halocynthiae TaxID=595589 RepID=A0A2T0X1Z6_9RHOB|nr:16S rRNA (cytidine(1402)-2'-O)-methyltransferase [Hasllibacter halocynthiae]PRY92972.1 16S rRNA (cytidine1402-2'-O)-methyltransferase [Hasllibacter halocynthiae]
MSESDPPSIPPGLTLVSVPIGNARDVTLRALDVLRGAEVLAAEDTRSLRRLMDIHGIPLNGRRIRPYHDANGARARPALMHALGEGRSVAYASEAGTPMIADPGLKLAREAVSAGIPVTAAPGPVAAVAALTLSGLPTDRFLFAGFPPPGAGARRRWLEGLAGAGATVILYESPRRVHRLLTEMRESFGDGRAAALAREVTKRFEEVIRGTLAEVAEATHGRELKGEVVVMAGPGGGGGAAEDLPALLAEALEGASLRDAVDRVAAATGCKRREVYRLALEMERGDGDGGDPEGAQEPR